MGKMTYDFFELKCILIEGFYEKWLNDKVDVWTAGNMTQYYMIAVCRNVIEAFIIQATILRLSAKYDTKYKICDFDRVEKERTKKELEKILQCYFKEEAEAQLTEHELKYLQDDLNYILALLDECKDSKSEVNENKINDIYINKGIKEIKKPDFNLSELEYLIYEYFHTYWRFEKYSIEEAAKKTRSEIFKEYTSKNKHVEFIVRSLTLYLYTIYTDFFEKENIEEEEKERLGKEAQEIMSICYEDEAKAELTEDEYDDFYYYVGHVLAVINKLKEF